MALLRSGLIFFVLMTVAPFVFAGIGVEYFMVNSLGEDASAYKIALITNNSALVFIVTVLQIL
ncbi:MAG: hypothetical protein ACXVB4_14020 [Pseudobdellovibrionaceae bacterium]